MSTKSTTTEFEEVFADVVHEGDAHQATLEVPISRRTPYLLFLIIVLIFVGFWARTAWLTIFKGAQLHAIATRNTERIFPILAPRGILYDRTGEALVENIPTFRMVIDRSRVPRDTSLFAEQVNEVAKILATDPAALEGLLSKADNGPYFVLLRDVPQNQAVALSVLQSQKDIFWFSVESVPERKYTDGPLFAHIIGYTGETTKEDLVANQKFFPTEEIGKNGIEFSFDTVLRGTTGKKVFVVNAQGKTDTSFVEQPTQNGKNVRLNIDANLQKVISQSLQEQMQKAHGTGAAAVAIDPRDGAVRALVSLPSFDNSVFAHGISADEYSNLVNDKAHPLLNRVIGGLYPSGSTIKPIIGLAALAEKVIDPRKQISDPGFISITNIYDPSIVYTFRDWKAHGLVNFVQAIAESCDVYFYTVGGGFGDIAGLGIERLAHWLGNFHFNQKTGIDLPGELSGFIPTPDWKQKEKNEPWVLGDTYHMSIGQGDFLTTPLELATATLAIVNNGILYKPNLVDAVIDAQGQETKVTSKVMGRIDADQTYFDLVKKGMRDAVHSGIGTAKLLDQVKVPVAAKTGTAQVGSKVPHAWITAFAPYDNPELVLAVLIEHGGEGSTTAAPVAKAAFDEYFGKQ